MKSIDPKHTANDLVAFLQKTFREAGFSEAAIAISGGVDSATSCALAVRALGPTQVYPLLLPYGKLNHQGVVDARLATRYLDIPEKNLTEVDIAPLVDPIILLDPGMDNVRRGNIMARVRMTVLFDHAKKHKALVVGTENKSEHLLGYFTRFGDEASDIEPLHNFYKTQVYELARYLGIPEPILTKKPTAGLWEGQTDEGEFGFTYKDADEILSLLYDKRKTPEEIVTFGFSQSLISRVQQRVNENSFKHRLPHLP